MSGTFKTSTKTINKKTPVENKMAEQLREAGLLGYRRNARFIEGRRFEADFYWPSRKIALEVDGGVWMRSSGHTSGAGYSRDRERDILALLNGILTVRYTSEQVRSGIAIASFRRIFEWWGGRPKEPEVKVTRLEELKEDGDS
jgi:very-short-patch-repair endonuclease